MSLTRAEKRGHKMKKLLDRLPSSRSFAKLLSILAFVALGFIYSSDAYAAIVLHGVGGPDPSDGKYVWNGTCINTLTKSTMLAPAPPPATHLPLAICTKAPTAPASSIGLGHAGTGHRYRTRKWPAARQPASSAQAFRIPVSESKAGESKVGISRLSWGT